MDKILATLLNTAYGKNFIVWIFSMLLLGIAALGWYCNHQAQKLESCNADLVKAERDFSKERERILRESITVYSSMLARIDALEKRKRK